jgi:hypothetical protein
MNLLKTKNIVLLFADVFKETPTFHNFLHALQINTRAREITDHLKII